MADPTENPYSPPSSFEMTEPGPSSATSPEVKRGRRLLAIAIAVSLTGDALVILLKVSRVGPQPSLSSVARWFMTAALFYAVWQGQRWARWLMTGLLGVGLLLTLFAVVANPHPLFLLIAAQFVVTFTLMVFPPSVSAFLSYQLSQQESNSE